MNNFSSRPSAARNYKFTRRFSLATPILLFMMFLVMNGGHGSYTPAVVLFPTGLISFYFFNSLETPFLILAILQFPIYGLIIDFSKNKAKAGLFLVAFHVSLLLFTYIKLSARHHVIKSTATTYHKQ